MVNKKKLYHKHPLRISGTQIKTFKGVFFYPKYDKPCVFYSSLNRNGKVQRGKYTFNIVFKEINS